jgi:hypothetical protein
MLEVVDVGGAGILDRPAYGAGHHDIAGHLAAKLCLGLRLSGREQSTESAEAKPALDAPAADPRRCRHGRTNRPDP